MSTTTLIVVHTKVGFKVQSSVGLSSPRSIIGDIEMCLSDREKLFDGIGRESREVMSRW